MMQGGDVKNLPGTYLLLIRLDASAPYQIGKLGTFVFQSGWYIYAGSALGPGGVAARLARHRRRRKRLHWHVDYLLAVSVLEATWHVVSGERLECAWAAAISALPRAGRPAPHFGSSDCRCRSHLVYLPYRPTDRQIESALAPVWPLVKTIVEP